MSFRLFSDVSIAELPKHTIEFEQNFNRDWDTSRPWDHLPSDTERSSWQPLLTDDDLLAVQLVLQASVVERIPILEADEFNPAGVWQIGSDGRATRLWQKSSPPLFHTNKEVLQEFGRWMTIRLIMT
jgi:hypothetical protein